LDLGELNKRDEIKEVEGFYYLFSWIDLINDPSFVKLVLKMLFYKILKEK